jgi:(1->4)-alpha-D-glucan 1-alpha-D-glucosylmutase
MIVAGRLEGLRIDHIDGLYDPAQYCRRLTEAVAGARRLAADSGDAGRGAQTDRGFYLVVEKILSQHENLREDWPVDGTTGYEVLNLINGLFVDPAGESALLRTYRGFTGDRQSFDQTLYDSKIYVIENLLGSELRVLANQLSRIAQSNWLTRDFTQNAIRSALKEIAACFPVYRTYVTGSGVDAADRRDIDWAVSWARRASVLPDHDLFDFVHRILTADVVARQGAGYSRVQVIRFAMRFQQFTGPVTAKALEDTAFYRYRPLLSLNEVGGDPRRFGVSVAAFHHLNQERARRWPRSMLATATHDTKRGEDVRARLDALSEIPVEWRDRVRRWARLARRLKPRIEGAACPAPDDEYMIYQTLLGSWPMELVGQTDPDQGALAGYRERVAAYLVKALREGKRRSTWVNPDGAYEEATTQFLTRLLDPAQSSAFLADFITFQRRVAFAGIINGLAQTVLKLSLPGVPDIYQGNELWDLDLVDPDNRRAVDYDRRLQLLARLRDASREDGTLPDEAVAAFLAEPRDGALKLFVIWRLLALRRRSPAVLADGGYVPLETRGARADSICAFARVGATGAAIAAVPRLVAGMVPDWGAYPLGADVWGDAELVLGDTVAAGTTFTDILTGAAVATIKERGECRLPAADLFDRLPVAVLTSGET